MQWAIIFTMLLLLQLPILAAQSCEPVTTSICSPLVPVGTLVFVPEGTTLAALQDAVVANIALGQAEPLSDACHAYGRQGDCGTWLRPCYQEGNGGTRMFFANSTLPADTCWYNPATKVPDSFGLGASIVGVGSYVPPAYSYPINCSNPYVDYLAYNTSLYAPPEFNVTYQGKNYTVPCGQMVLSAVPYQIDCGPNLVLNEEQQVCGFSCPLPSLSDSQYENVKIMQGILGWLSWCSTAALILFLVVCPKARGFPRNMVIMTASAANIVAGAVIMPTYAGYDNIWCGGGNQFVFPKIDLSTSAPAAGKLPVTFSLSDLLDFESSACTFQGAMLQFGFLAAVFWWGLIAFNMCFEIYLKPFLPIDRPHWKWARFGVYNLIGWGLPFLFMVIPAAAGAINFQPAATFCFVSNQDGNAWSLTFWFIPVGIAMLLGAGLFIAVLVRLTIMAITIRKIKSLAFLYLRLCIFVLLYLTLIVFIMAYNIQNAVNQSSIQNGYEEYYTCLTYGLGNCSLDDSVTNYNLVMLKGFAVSSLGILLSITFISLDVLKFWYELAVQLYLLLKKPDSGNLRKFLAKLASSGSTQWGTTSLESVGSSGLQVDPKGGGQSEDESHETGVEDEEEEKSERNEKEESSSSEE